MKIAVTIVHNKTPEQNEAQIAALLPLVEQITDTYTDPESGETFAAYHYELKTLALDHEVRFYQVIPHGVTPPPNLYDLDSAKVFYGPEDAQRGAPRFFNWGLKRGIDQGADIVVYLADPTQLTPNKLRQGINALKDDVELIDLPWVKLITKRALWMIGQLREDGTLTEKLGEYKERVIRGGLKHG